MPKRTARYATSLPLPKDGRTKKISLAMWKNYIHVPSSFIFPRQVEENPHLLFINKEKPFCLKGERKY